jgi:hypothetical protein
MIDAAELVKSNREWLAGRIGWTAVYACVAIGEAYPEWAVWYDGHRQGGRGYHAETRRDGGRCHAWGREPDQLLGQLAEAEERFALMAERFDLRVGAL